MDSSDDDIEDWLGGRGRRPRPRMSSHQPRNPAMTDALQDIVAISNQREDRQQELHRLYPADHAGRPTLCMFANCKTITELPEAVFQYLHLEQFNVINCPRLSSVPSSIGQLRMLTLLNLTMCGGITEIPESVGQLQALRWLTLPSLKSLRSLPESLGQLKCLETLNVSWCYALTTLPESLSQLPALQQLYCSYCISLTRLPAGVYSTPSLSITGCDALVFPPPGVVSQGLVAVRRFLSTHYNTDVKWLMLALAGWRRDINRGRLPGELMQHVYINF